MKNLFLVFTMAMFFITGCGERGGTLYLTLENAPSASGDDPSPGPGGTPNNPGPGSTPYVKPILSLWADVNNFYMVDLRNAKIGQTSSMVLTAVVGGSCTCSVLINGTESSGNISISSCSGTLNIPDPSGPVTCNSFNAAFGSGKYTKSSANLLQVCNPAATQCLNLK